jgi:hypothetical protein
LKVTLNDDPSLEPGINKHVSQRDAALQEKRTLDIVLDFLQKSVEFFEKSINVTDLIFLASIKEANHLLVDLIDPNSHFSSLQAISRNELAS